ncbi:uncharacterized protein LOC115891022 isoform X2 [Sitophilus oryzae]|uniref:Uncharacterized protein LOC115891022 isoform X2 n=1 Tax=Sitophilus oryzae TaxID=7048 RepID=A0A6J2YT55_SITOR|nr:uncharacterized protein LOC115891022 isoform X2 [Sitophilus oryzae]
MEAHTSQSQTKNKKCPLCDLEFSCVSARNRHMKNFHNQILNTNARKSHIICPLCTENEIVCGSYKILEEHLEVNHGIKLEIETHNFATRESYEEWFEEQKIKTNYVSARSKKINEYVEKSYNCNRSNSEGHISKCSKRTEKAGGSIKIYGICPSRLNIKIWQTEETTVKFWKSHVGHEEEIRSQHLSEKEKNEIVSKLSSGVTVERIISDARKITSETENIQRINILNRKDVSYLMKKHNIMKKKHENSMIAVALKVEEWNANGKNYCFFFKQQGESHPVLRVEDFCLGFMNEIMERKLMDCCRIICMDGTHCTNQKGMDLTIMLVKDDRNMGFPALRDKVNRVIEPQYFMTDDDSKYYNAWVKTMGTTPRRLLCSWHIIKNWVIQGRSKIRNEEIKKTMKTDLKKILNETKVEKFAQLTQKYFQKLQNADEHVFLNYLTKYYYQSEERITMWAHCHRINAGINTNMALESLNNLLKTNQLKRKSNITIDRLLEEIENLVDGKMWQRILMFERPHSNTYQDRIVTKAHKLAEIMKANHVEVLEVGFGEFRVKSSTGNSFYKILYKELCETECKTLYCKICKVCIHRYICDCPEYAIKTTICKHIHLVCLHEHRPGSESVLGDVAQLLSKNKSSDIKEEHKEEIEDFIREKRSNNNDLPMIDDTEDYNLTQRTEIANTFKNFILSLNGEAFKRVVGKYSLIMDQENRLAGHKRKMDKQEFFPTKRRK